jgi:hypothetical protein
MSERVGLDLTWEAYLVEVVSDPDAITIDLPLSQQCLWSIRDKSTVDDGGVKPVPLRYY